MAEASFSNPPTGAIAIVVHRMIQAKHSGVAIDKDGGETLVEGVTGLGDSLVGGRSEGAPLPPRLRSDVDCLAREAQKPIYQIIGHTDSNPTPVTNAGRVLSWSWDNLKTLFR